MNINGIHLRSKDCARLAVLGALGIYLSLPFQEIGYKSRYHTQLFMWDSSPHPCLSILSKEPSLQLLLIFVLKRENVLTHMCAHTHTPNKCCLLQYVVLVEMSRVSYSPVQSCVVCAIQSQITADILLLQCGECWRLEGPQLVKPEDTLKHIAWRR